MTQTEWIVSIDDDMKDYDEMFVGNVRAGEQLIRCKDCKYYLGYKSYGHYCENDFYVATGEDFCSRAERKEE